TGNVSVSVFPDRYAVVTPVYTTNQIVTPTNGVEVTGATNIVGTAWSDYLDYWKVDYRLRTEGPPVWVTLASGVTNVLNGMLATFDPTSLRNGIYDVRLTAVDILGTVTQTSIELRLVEGAKIGQFTLSFTDLQIPVSGLPITLTRTY